MKISVIIPAYNAERELATTLEHLFRSDHDDFEVIVVDDASTDRTIHRAEQFPVTVVRQSPNGGAAKARNRGNQMANGEVLFFIDADVRVQENTLSLVRQTFESGPSVTAVVGAYTPEQPVPSFFSHFQNFYTWFNHDKCLDGPKGPITWFWTACGAIRRDVFTKMQGFREIYVGASAEDMDLGYRLTDAGQTIVLNKEIEVTHAHLHTLKSILRNNFKKAAAWGELHLRTERSERYKHGFTSIRNYLSMLLVALLFLSFLAMCWVPLSGVVALVSLLGIAAINHEFYALLRSSRGTGFMLRGFLFHIVATFAAGLGGTMAIIRRLTGREGEVQ